MAQSVVGTPEFMAPELYEEKYGTAVDIYAFGMCLVEIISQKFPYAECTTTGQLFLKVMSGERPEAVKRIRDPALRKIVQDCLQVDPKLRPTAESLL